MYVGSARNRELSSPGSWIGRPVPLLPRWSRVAALLIFELGAVVVLHLLGDSDLFQVGWSNFSDWLDTTPVEDVIAAGVRLIALGIAYWLLFSTLAYVIASFSRRSAAIRATAWMTLPPVRRLVRRSVALSIAASSIVVPLGPSVASLALGSRTSTVVMEVDPGGVISHSSADLRSEDRSGDEGGTDDEVLLPPHLQSLPDPLLEPVVAPQPDSNAVLDPTTSHVHKVVRGENLWRIACQHLEEVSGRTNLAEHEIAPYWVRVIEANRLTIRSGDPDLIYPGEQIILPPVDG